MIVAEHIESDIASINTLVDPNAADQTQTTTQKTPRHLGKLLLASIFLNLVAFTFSLVDTLPQNVPLDSVANILACILTLPHHCAALLVIWLQRHRSESIFPFTPYSPRAVAYTIFLSGLWIVSTTYCGLRLHSSSRTVHFCQAIDWTKPLVGSNCIPGTASSYTPFLIDFWPSVASTLTSALALISIMIIALVCYIHRQQSNKTVLEISPTPSSEHEPPSQTKVISA